jgi:hypothetical protein
VISLAQRQRTIFRCSVAVIREILKYISWHTANPLPSLETGTQLGSPGELMREMLCNTTPTTGFATLNKSKHEPSQSEAWGPGPKEQRTGGWPCFAEQGVGWLDLQRAGGGS